MRRHGLALAAVVLMAASCLPAVMASNTTSADPVTLRSPFFNLTAAGDTLYRRDGTATFALTALILLLIALLGGLMLIAWFRRSLRPVYGARLKFNVVTGRAVYKEAPVRTLPTPEERAQQEEQRKWGPHGQSMHGHSAPSSQTRLEQVCPRGCDDSFWCPPCLLSCSCLDCLWCGPRLCCGASSLGEWMFERVYRNPAARWFALVAQFVIMALDILAMALDRWSTQEGFVLPGDPTGDEWELRVGVIGTRAGSMTADFDCPGAIGSTKMQCDAVRVAGGWVLALGLLLCIFMAALVIWSLRIRCSTVLNRAYTPGMTLLSLAHTITLAAVLLLWPLVAQLVLRDVYAPSLGLGGSWAALFCSFVLSVFLTFYFRCQVHSISVVESLDPDAIEAEAREQRLREEAERKLREVDPYGLNATVGASGAGKVLVVNPEQLDLAERRAAEEAQWGREGYGPGSPLSPLAMYASGAEPGSTVRNPLGTLTKPLKDSLSSTGRQPVVQRGYYANEPIPAPQVMEPSPEELARRHWEREREMARRVASTPKQKLDGPYTAASPPVYIDATERQPHQQMQRGMEGFGESAQGGAELPRSLYSYSADEAAPPGAGAGPIPSPPNPATFSHLDPSFVRDSLPLDDNDLRMLAEDRRIEQEEAEEEARMRRQQQGYGPHVTPARYGPMMVAERTLQPNLLNASLGPAHPQRLPPLHYPPSEEPLPAAFGRSGPQYGFGTRGAPMTPHYQYDPSVVRGPHSFGGEGSHPFTLQSPTRQHHPSATLSAAERNKNDGRVYTYAGMSQPSTQRGPRPHAHGATISHRMPSVSSDSHDIHFASTQSRMSPHHLRGTSTLGASQMVQWHQQQQRAEQQVKLAAQDQPFHPHMRDDGQDLGATGPLASPAPLMSPSLPLSYPLPTTPHASSFPAGLSIVVQGADDPLNRTIATPMPVRYPSAAEREQEEYERRAGAASPYTPRASPPPNGAAALRHTPRATAGPYSQAFAQ